MSDIQNDYGAEENYVKKRFVRFFSTFAAFISAVLFSLSFVNDFEPETRLFKYGSWLFEAGFIAVFISCLFIIIFTCIFIAKNKENHMEMPESFEYCEGYTLEPSGVKWTRYIAAAMIFGGGIVKMFLLFSGGIQIGAYPVFTMLEGVLFIPLVLYFVPEIAKITGSPKMYLYYGTAGIFMFVCGLVSEYGQTETAVASGYCIYRQICLIAATLAFTYEIAMKTKVRSPRMYLATLCTAFTVCFGFTFGRVIMLMAGKFVSFQDTADIMMWAGISIYFAARVHRYNED